MQDAAAGRGRRCCFLCGAGAAYRCPACRQRYCSLPCYKAHKGQCAPEGDAAPPLPPLPPPEDGARAALPPDEEPQAGEGPFALDDILTEDDEGDRVPLPRLQRLGASVELGGLLRNRHLRRLLLRVDGARDKGALLREAMQEPLFAEFADCCLRIVDDEEENPLQDLGHPDSGLC